MGSSHLSIDMKSLVCLLAATAFDYVSPAFAAGVHPLQVRAKWHADFDLFDAEFKSAAACIKHLKEREDENVPPSAFLGPHRRPLDAKSPSALAGTFKGADKKVLKQVTCEQIPHGDMDIFAKYRVIYYLNTEGGLTYELPFWKNGFTQEAANYEAHCIKKDGKKWQHQEWRKNMKKYGSPYMCCDAWMWDSAWMRCEYSAEAAKEVLGA